jgi:threonine dehydrogenase-like Zn-dependent dehydrogenase
LLGVVRPTGECGSCEPCRRGFMSACRDGWGTAHGIAIDGGLADLVEVDPARVFPMADGARPKDAALVEPLAIAWHGVRRAAPPPGSRALVVGAGSIGLLAAVALQAWGVEVDIVSRHAHQSAAAEALGARVVDRPKGWAYETTLDAVCTQETFDHCVAAAVPGGTVLEFGMFWTPVQLSNALMFKEVTLVPTMGYSHAADHDDFRESADHLAAHPEVADVLVTHTFGLDDAVEAFRVAADRASGAIKVHLVP